MSATTQPPPSKATPPAATIDTTISQKDQINAYFQNYEAHNNSHLLIERMGGPAEYEMVLNCYIENLLQDVELVRLFQSTSYFDDPNDLLEQQEHVLDVVFAKDPEHANIRVAMYYKEFTERGFRREHYLRFRDHFIDALRENWGEEDVVAEVKECFDKYATIFDAYESSDMYYFPNTHQNSNASKRKQDTTAATTSTPAPTVPTITTTPQARPKKTITAALQQTPAGIRALKNKLTRHHVNAVTSSPTRTAHHQEEEQTSGTISPPPGAEGGTSTTSPMSPRTAAIEQKKRRSLRDVISKLMAPPEL